MNKAERPKRGKSRVFPFYSLLAGWQQLFKSARRVYYHCRGITQKPRSLITPDLFADSSIIIPIGQNKGGHAR